MSLFVPEFDETVIVRDAGAEVIGGAPVGVFTCWSAKSDKWA
ncbi:hypothetical protein ABZ464_48280 [Streptomyces sp. NPDC005820]